VTEGKRELLGSTNFLEPAGSESRWNIPFLKPPHFILFQPNVLKIEQSRSILSYS
jgi:hypothetical protein